MPDRADGAPQRRARKLRDASSSDTRRSDSRRARRAAVQSRRGPPRARARRRACTCGTRRAAAPSSAVRPLRSRAPDARAAALPPPRRRRAPAPSAACADAMPRMQREEPVRAARRAAGGAPDEFLDGRRRTTACALRLPRAARSRTGIRVRARSPTARRAAPDRRRDRDRWTCRRAPADAAKRRSASASRVCAACEQRLRLLLQLFEIRTGGQLARHRTTSMLEPVVRKQAARRCWCRWSVRYDGGLGPSREPAGAL